MRDFDDVVAANLADRESSVGQASDAFRTQTRRGVRVRRARRHAYESVAVVGVVAVVVGLGWAGAGGDGDSQPAPPAPSVTPTVDPSPSHSPSETPRATPSATPSVSSSPKPSVAPTIAPTITPSTVGPVKAMPRGLLKTSEAGWLLTVYQGDFDSGAPGAIVVTDLDRNRYHVLDLPPRADLSVHAWEPGSTRVLVSQSRRGDRAPVPRGYLDLTTGIITPDARGLLAAESLQDLATSYVGLDADGRELWVEYEVSGDGSGAGRLVALADDGPVELAQIRIGWSALQVDPTGRRAVVGAGSEWSKHYLSIDLMNGTAREVAYGVDGKGCQVVGWLDAAQLLTSCQDESSGTEYGMHRWGAPDASFELYRVPIAGVKTPLPVQHPPGALLPAAASGAWLDDSIIAFTAEDPELSRQTDYLWEGGTLTELGPSEGRAVGSGSVYVGRSEAVRPLAARLGLGLDLLGEPPADTPFLGGWVVAGGPWSR
jgi:hypothetical protein